MVTIPYVRGVSEAVQRALERPGVAASVKPHKALKQLLVHPKDMRSPCDTVEIVYLIPCKQNLMVYVGETGRRYGVREQEYMKDVKQLEGQSCIKA